jgi:hypothetical protein
LLTGTAFSLFHAFYDRLPPVRLVHAPQHRLTLVAYPVMRTALDSMSLATAGIAAAPVCRRCSAPGLHVPPAGTFVMKLASYSSTIETMHHDVANGKLQ